VTSKWLLRRSACALPRSWRGAEKLVFGAATPLQEDHAAWTLSRSDESATSPGCYPLRRAEALGGAG
jgi:hypothetical protein